MRFVTVSPLGQAGCVMGLEYVWICSECLPLISVASPAL